MDQGPERSILDAIKDEFDATCNDIVAGADRRQSVRAFTRFARSLIVTYQFTSSDQNVIDTMAEGRRLISLCLANLENTLALKLAAKSDGLAPSEQIAGNTVKTNSRELA